MYVTAFSVLLCYLQPQWFLMGAPLSWSTAAHSWPFLPVSIVPSLFIATPLFFYQCMCVSESDCLRVFFMMGGILLGWGKVFFMHFWLFMFFCYYYSVKQFKWHFLPKKCHLRTDLIWKACWYYTDESSANCACTVVWSQTQLMFLCSFGNITYSLRS